MTTREKKGKERKRNQRQRGCLGAAAPRLSLGSAGAAWPGPMQGADPVQVVRTQMSGGDTWPAAAERAHVGVCHRPGLPRLPPCPASWHLPAQVPGQVPALAFLHQPRTALGVVRRLGPPSLTQS